MSLSQYRRAGGGIEGRQKDCNFAICFPTTDCSCRKANPFLLRGCLLRRYPSPYRACLLQPEVSKPSVCQSVILSLKGSQQVAPSPGPGRWHYKSRTERIMNNIIEVATRQDLLQCVDLLPGLLELDKL